MAKNYFRKKILLAKIESLYADDPTPTGALNAIQTKDLEIDPLEGEALSRKLDRDSFGADLSTLVGKHVRVRFKVEVAGSGAAGTAPAYGVLLRACGHSETVNAGVDVTYTPIDESVPSVYSYFKRGLVLHKIAGARGMVKMVASKRNYGYFEFEFIGLYVGPVASSAITAVLTAFQRPVPFRASTVDCDLAGVTVGLHEISIDGGQKVEFYEHSEEESIQITDRESKFSAKFEEPEIGTHDFFADISTDTTGAFDFQIGTTAGNIVQVTAATSQIGTLKVSDTQGVSTFDVTGTLVPDSTNPDYRIVIK
jgi:hypothetical protein